ncbi:DUF3866 family protein [Marinicrinis lubricantis]|uniref:DUF3866 family protein n=1 Tax=Marinicrinis lubricantis TaxID=2086470 RepID=A0ABW1ISD7_9BACL
MMYTEIGKVLEVVGDDGDLIELKVQVGEQVEKAFHYQEWHQKKPAIGDFLLLNTTAVRLGLGTGGFHFVIHVLGPDRGGFHEVHTTAVSQQPGHMIKLRYTPLQRKMLAAEEEASPVHHLFHKHKQLQGLPVLIGELHSMLPVASSWFAHQSRMEKRPIPRLVYVMTDGGALPISFSSHVRQLKQSGWLHGTVTYGHAYGGDVEALNKYTALIAAKWVLEADAVIVCMGPGIAGTGTPYGHTGMEVGEIINAVRSLKGIPILMPRLSFADRRIRHQGLSHHTEGILQIAAMSPAVIPLSSIMNEEHKRTIQRQLEQWGIPEKHEIHWCEMSSEEIRSAIGLYPHSMKTMGRGLDDDPDFFSAVCAAAQYAWSLIHAPD